MEQQIQVEEQMEIYIYNTLKEGDLNWVKKHWLI